MIEALTVSGVLIGAVSVASAVGFFGGFVAGWIFAYIKIGQAR